MSLQNIGICRLFFLILTCMINGCSYDPGKEEILNGNEKPAMHSVEIVQMKFVPAELRAKQGDTILFINHDMVSHNVTEEAAESWSSSTLASGQSWKLEVKGSSQYLCTLHPVMKGKIIVE